jgi:hypothetical protein
MGEVLEDIFMKGHEMRELRIGNSILKRRSVCNLEGGKGVGSQARTELRLRFRVASCGDMASAMCGLHNDQCSPPSTRDRWLERGTSNGGLLLVAWLQIHCFTVYRLMYIEETVT